MIAEYIRAAMHRATYEILPEDRTYVGRIPDFDGVWSNAATLEACRDELADVLEGWIILGLWLHHELPVIDGLDLNVTTTEVA